MECATSSIETWKQSGVYADCFAAMNLKKLSTWQLEHMSSYLLLYKIAKHQSTLLVKRKLILLSTFLKYLN